MAGEERAWCRRATGGVVSSNEERERISRLLAPLSESVRIADSTSRSPGCKSGKKVDEKGGEAGEMRCELRLLSL